MPEPALRVRGIRRLGRTMKRAEVDVADLKDAHQRAANTVAAAARPRAPVDTGALKGSIRGNRAQYKAIVRAGSKRIPYARPVHWGRDGRSGRPFISDAAQASEADWYDDYLRDVEKIIGKVKGI